MKPETVDRRSETRQAEGTSSPTPSYQKETFSTIPTDERNRREVPLGLDRHEVAPEFVRVWISNVQTVGAIFGIAGTQSLLVFPDEQQAWEFRGRFSKLVIRCFGDPFEWSLLDAIGYAVENGGDSVLLVNGKGEVLKVYPV